MSAIPTSFSSLSPGPATFNFLSFLDEEGLDVVAAVSMQCLKCVAAFRLNDFEWQCATTLQFGNKLALETKKHHAVWKEVHSALTAICNSLAKRTPVITASTHKESTSSPNTLHPKSAKRPTPLKIPDSSDEDKINNTNPGSES